MCNSHAAPQAKDTFLTSTSEIDSESVLSFNFGDSTGVLVILVIGVVLCVFLYQLFSCCMDGRCSSCSRQQRPNYDQGLNSALITLAFAVGQQQNVSQQQQHQQVQDHQQQQPTRVTPGYSYSTVNQALLPTAPAPQLTKPSYLSSPLWRISGHYGSCQNSSSSAATIVSRSGDKSCLVQYIIVLYNTLQ